jgi:hypothetical protein
VTRWAVDSRAYDGLLASRWGATSGSGSARLGLSQKGGLPSPPRGQAYVGPRSPTRAMLFQRRPTISARMGLAPSVDLDGVHFLVFRPQNVVHSAISAHEVARQAKRVLFRGTRSRHDVPIQSEIEIVCRPAHSPVCRIGAGLPAGARFALVSARASERRSLQRALHRSSLGDRICLRMARSAANRAPAAS